jgi:hypothetical protein
MPAGDFEMIDTNKITKNAGVQCQTLLSVERAGFTMLDRCMATHDVANNAMRKPVDP